MEQIIREAEIKDIRQCVTLTDKLVKFEENLCKAHILIDNPDERHNGIVAMIGEALVNPDSRVLIVQKSGRIIALFIASIINKPTVFKHNRICNVWLGISQENCPIEKVLSEFQEWGKEKGCNALSCHVLNGNKKVQRFCENGYNANKIFNVYEKSI